MTNSQEPQGQEQNAEIMLSNSGKPFGTESQALFTFAAKRLSNDSHEIVKYQDGYAIVARKAKEGVGAGKAAPEPSIEPELDESDFGPVEPQLPPPAPKERVLWVQFNDRTNEQEEEKVVLTVNHDTLVIKRMAKVPIPERFIECAQHAARPVFKQMPGEPRKVEGHVHTYPFSILGEATWDDYWSMRRKGTKDTQDRILNDSTLNERREEAAAV